ncbi:hypothetical protein LQV05_003825 [Cryptococcus neoformans]|nr:hypothetical protein J007_03107 [Cryptococcus neoformans var. grubii]UOH81159.1 hypothetical protein LQV05_003825 [Cryptococcus neoformans]
MKPSTKLHIPISEKTSPFFSSPYPSHQPSSSQLSPIPGSSSSSAAFTNSRSPLLAPSPKVLESAYPFPAMTHTSACGRWARVRMALRQGVVPQGVLRRMLMLFMVLGLTVLALHRSGTALQLAEKYNPASTHTESHVPYVPPTSSPHGVREIDISSEPLPLEATLRERLDAWKNAPGGRGEVEGEVESGGFMAWNLEQCSTISEQHNTHMIQHSANTWASLNRTLLHKYRMELIDHMEGVLKRREHEKYGEGRGIVTVAGNADTLQRVKWSLQMLRSYGSELPVEIYHFPSESPPADDPIRTELAELGARLVEAKGQTRDKGKNKSYHLKALAVVQCPWQEVLYIDSDSIPTRDPSYMFDAPNYKRLGIWATPDYWKTSANNPIWAIMGVKCRNEWEMETGQVFIDKKRHLDVFLLVQYMLENHHFWFAFSDGDKDTFRWALLALRKRWAVPGRWVGAAALPSGTASGDFCAHTMLQHDSWGEPLFVHYNLLKQIPSGVGRGYSWGRTKQLPLFNTWPATPSTARLGEPERRPDDGDKRGLGDVDCDMLADAGEDGRARGEAKEMVMRRAARERGVKVKYHGGVVSALCIDLEYIDPRPKERQEEDAARRAALSASASLSDSLPESTSADGDGTDDTSASEEWVGVVEPDWSQSPIEIVHWRDDEHLKSFEKTIYDFGFKPSGKGF